MTKTIDRTQFLGSSEMGILLGLDQYRSPLKLWAIKTGRLTNEITSEAAEWGTRLEGVVAQKFAEKNGCKLMAYKKRFVHPVYPFISCELDRIIVGTDEIVEVKTCHDRLIKNWSGEDMPQNYCVQLNTALGLSGRKKGHIALLAGGQKYIEKHMDFDQELYDMVIEKAVAFWNNHVLADLAPVAIAMDNDEPADTLDLLYPASNSQAIEFCGDVAKEIDVLVDDRLGALESMSHLKEELNKIEARIKQLMGENEEGTTANSRISWKTVNRKEYTVKASSYRQIRTTKTGEAK